MGMDPADAVKALHTPYVVGKDSEKHADIQIIRRFDGSIVAAFSVRGYFDHPGMPVAEDSIRASTHFQEEAVSAAADQLSLKVRFLGKFELFCNGEEIVPSCCGTALAILKYLLAYRDEPVSQDHLMCWQWPESDLKRARWALNSAIYRMRKLLDYGPSSTSLTYILLEKGYYRLNPTVRVETDVDKFDTCYEQGLKLARANRMPEAIAEYEKAIEVYRDDYLVEDLSEGWTMVERERLLSEYINMLDQLTAYYCSVARYQESLHYCYRLLKKDPFLDRAHGRVMECYGCLGMPARASSHYQHYQYTLRRELGKNPSPELQHLHRKISSKIALPNGSWRLR